MATGKGVAVLGEIVVFADNRTEGSNILEFAGLLADEIQPSPPDTPQQSFARGKGIGKVIEKHRSQLESIEARHRTRFEDVVHRHGIRDPEWKSLSQWNNEVAINAYYADLVVIGRPERGGQGSDPPGLAESLVLSSGRPVILFPPGGTASPVRRILIGWSATREAIRAAADAVPLLGRAKAVEVLIVDYERQREHQWSGARCGHRTPLDGSRRTSGSTTTVFRRTRHRPAFAVAGRGLSSRSPCHGTVNRNCASRSSVGSPGLSSTRRVFRS